LNAVHKKCTKSREEKKKGVEKEKEWGERGKKKEEGQSLIGSHIWSPLIASMKKEKKGEGKSKRGEVREKGEGGERMKE